MHSCGHVMAHKCLRTASSNYLARQTRLRRTLSTRCAFSPSVKPPIASWPVTVAAWCVSKWQRASDSFTRVCMQQLPQMPEVTPEQVNQNVQSMFKQMRMLVLVAPFASLDVAGATTLAVNVWLPFWQALFGFSNFYLFILFMRVLLSWFPALDWSRNPWLVIKVITDPYLNVFRNIIPALFMAIDLTPLLGFMLLQDFVAILENCVIENLFSDTIDEPTSDPFIYLEQDFSRFTQRA